MYNRGEGMSAAAVTATVIIVGDRFYHGKSKSGRVQIAWSLAGAELFLNGHTAAIEKVERLLSGKGYQTARATVTLG